MKMASSDILPISDIFFSLLAVDTVIEMGILVSVHPDFN